MSNEVYANTREVSCKQAAGKSICAFPDVCMTPPQTPVTPPGVPIPYPNTGMASDTTDGSKSVTAKGKEVMLKNKSYFKKSMGDEAATKAQGMGVVTHQIQGKVYFTAWSMDVKFEGENVVRHLDLTTHNHNPAPGNSPPWPFMDTMNPDTGIDPCKKHKEETEKACADSPVKKPRKCSKECKKAMECTLVPKGKDKKYCCAPNNTGDHVIEDHWVRPKGKAMPGFKKIKRLYNGAPTMCVNKSRYKGKHGIAHGTRGYHEDKMLGKKFPYDKAKKMGLQAHSHAFPDSKCNKQCMEAQLDSFYGSEGKLCQASKGKQPLKPGQRASALARIKANESSQAGALS